MPPCNCHPPFPRPEPFSPLPRPGKTPDWGKWIRDRLAEKGALLPYPSSGAFPDPGAGPDVYVALDTGVLYRWDGSHYQVLVDPSAANDVLEYGDRGRFPETGEHGKLYIAADTGSMYRWGGEDYVELLPGKADKAVPQAAGNFAALTQDGNLVDSRRKPSDFADAANTYTKEQTDDAIDRVAAYYITYTAAGAAFPTRAALLDAMAYYSGGELRVPTRNDYAIVLADESHGGAEWRYIYAVADGAMTGQWEAQYPVEGVITFDNAVTKDSTNGVKSSGIWSMLWGTLWNIPEGLTSVYAWVLNRLGLKRDKSDMACTVDVAGMPQIGSGKFIVTPPSGTPTTLNPFESSGVQGWGWYMDYPYIFARAESQYDIIFGSRIADIIPLNMTAKTQTVVHNGETWTVDAFTGEIANTRIANMMDLPSSSTSTPAMDGVGAAGTSAAYARGDHVHPSDTSKQDALTFDNAPTTGSNNPVKSSGIWSAIWGALASPPTGFTSLYDWVVNQLAGKASTADATLTEKYGYEWRISADKGPHGYDLAIIYGVYFGPDIWALVESYTLDAWEAIGNPPADATTLTFNMNGTPVTATRFIGYQLGSQTDKPLASEAEAEALRNGKQDALTAPQLANIAAVPNKANRAANPTAGNLAALDANGNPTDAGYHFEVRNGIPCIVQYT